jgi:hypothetical protein
VDAFGARPDLAWAVSGGVRDTPIKTWSVGIKEKWDDSLRTAESSWNSCVLESTVHWT